MASPTSASLPTAAPSSSSSTPPPLLEPPEAPSTEADRLLFDAEGLAGLAREAVVRRGFAYFREDRVFDLGFEQGERLWASVEGSRELPYQVEVWLDEDGEICVECDCPYDWEPACKHAIAALLAYAARQPVPGAVIASAADEAVMERGKRGRSEVEVTHLDGDRWCGTWQARSLSGSSGGPYTVELFSVGERLNSCTCPDFATNRLGTCKHIEAVRHHLRRRAPRKFERLERRGIDRPVVHLDWQGPDAPTVRMRMPRGRSVPAELTRWFDPATGAFSGRLPDDLPGLTTLAAKGLAIGRDVVEHVRHVATDAAQAERSRRIAAELRHAGGRLPGVHARLYPYQVEGAAFLAGRGRAMLADDMGLGKTLQAIAAATVLQRQEGVRRTLVLCPASLKHQWAREIERFTGQDAMVVQGRRAVRQEQYRIGAPFTILNYELLLRDREEIQRWLCPDLLILDEAQRIKNWRTKTAASVKALDTRFAFVLTGTPLENRLEDLYSLMQVVDPRVLGPLWSFLLEFHVTDTAGRVLGYRNLSELRRRLAPVMLRRDRRLVSDQLPERIQHRLDVVLDDKQRKLHDDAEAAASRLAAIMQKRPLTPLEEQRFMAALQRARMACDAAGLVDGETEGSPKLSELADLFTSLCLEGDHKVVVFTEWERMSRMAKAVAESLGLDVIRLHGGVPTRKRGALIERFHEDPTARVFISTDAGATGLNLQCATALVNLDLPWNPAVLEQRIARIHRLGQRQSVQIFVMIALASYEEKVAGLVASKRRLFDNAVDPEGTEDAIGLTKRAVELAGELLDDEDGEGRKDPVDAEEDVPVALAPDEDEQAPPLPEGDTPVGLPPADLSALVAHIERLLPGRIERVVARGGGLLVVVDEVDAVARSIADSLGGSVPLVVVDQSTFVGLCQLDHTLARAETIEAAAVAPPRPSPARKLAAARVVLAQDMVDEALGLVVDGLLMALAGDEPPPSREQAPLWLFSAGHVAPADTALVSQALALSQVPGVPVDVARAVLDQAETLIARG